MITTTINNIEVAYTRTHDEYIDIYRDAAANTATSIKLALETKVELTIEAEKQAVDELLADLNDDFERETDAIISLLFGF